ncbi:MAG: hypothetical protein KKE53_19955, partial [Proteobacteria bacterium]|nr:hypothetical protein [Pseudomonadota bacterium]
LAEAWAISSYHGAGRVQQTLSLKKNPAFAYFGDSSQRKIRQLQTIKSRKRTFSPASFGAGKYKSSTVSRWVSFQNFWK